MSSLNAGTINNAAKGDQEAMRTVLNAINAQILALANGTGVALLEPTSGGKAQTPVAAPPAAAALTATGANGSHNLAIINPTSTIPAVLYHQLSYSDSPNFGNATSLPPTTATTLTIPAPGTTRNWRIRSSYDQVHWNSWAAAQGNPSVDAGLQSSAATDNAVALNQTNYCTVDSVPGGTGNNVRVYGTAGPQTSWISVKGPDETVQPSATIINQAAGTKPFVGFNGDQFLVASTLPQVFGDEVTPVGQVGVPTGGSVILPTITAVLSGGGVVGFNVTSGGSNIGSALTISISGPGAGATAGAQTITGGVLQSVAPGNAGTGYTSAAVTPSGGAAAGKSGGGTATGNNGGRLTAIQGNG